MKVAAVQSAREASAKQDGGRVAAFVLPAPQPLFAPMVTVQRKCACGGSCPRCEEEKPGPDVPAVQTKLAVNAPGDSFEHQADLIADEVVRPVGGSSMPVQRQVDEEDNEEGGGLERPSPARVPLIQAKGSRGRAPPEASSSDVLESRIVGRKGYGSPLTGAVSTFMEDRFQADFGRVRVHTDPEADALNQDLHSFAFTSGHDIFFAQGQFRPGTTEGDRLLAHELAHVIQQAGDAAPARRTRVQRLGNWAHNEVQNRLIGVNDDLLTEVHIPGAKRPTDLTIGFDPDLIGVRGYADLYRSKGHVVSGVRAVPVKPDDPEAVGQPPLKYWNVGKSKKRPIGGKPKPVFAPRIAERRPYKWKSTPGFPSSFEVGELKPLFLSDFPGAAGQAGLGTLQIDNYIGGFEEFVKRTHTDSGGVTTASISGSRMPIGQAQGGIRIPAEIDYGQLRSQTGTPDPKKAILKANSNERLWVSSPEAGQLYYFLLPDTESPSYRQDLEIQVTKVEALLTDLRNRPAALGNQLKARPGPPGRALKARLSAAPAGTVRVQRQPQPGPVPADLAGKWKPQWEAWEKKRAEWSGGRGKPGTAVEFLATTGAGPAKKVEVDEKLGLSAAATQIPQERSKLKRLDLWSGPSGYVLGLLRFRFSALFERLEQLFLKIRTKFRDFREKAAGSVKFESGNWKKAALEIIGGILVEFLKEMVTAAFTIAANCVNAVVGKVIDHFKQELTKELEPVLETVRGKIEELQKMIEEKYGSTIDTLQQALATLETIRYWTNIASKIEIALRLLIQAISCGLPPGLGCLWGLVAQIGFNAVAARAIKTDRFRDRIARPAARSLVDAVAGDTIRTFMSSLIEKVGLGKELKGLTACEPGPHLEGARLGDRQSFSSSDPELEAARKELEKKYGARMMADLEKVFTSGGKPATPAHIEELVKKIQQSGISVEDLSRLLAPKGQGIDIKDVVLRLPAGAAGETGAGQEEKGGGGKGTTEGGVPVVDVSKNEPYKGPPGGTGTSEVTMRIIAEESHKPGKEHVFISAWAFKGGKTVLMVTQIEVIVTGRESKKDAEGPYERITYTSVPPTKVFYVEGQQLIVPTDLFALLRPAKK